MIKTCDICNKEFTTNRDIQKRCGKDCSLVARRIKATESVARRRREIASIVKTYLGGECVICGYDKCARALDAHHVNEDDKEFSLSSKGLTRSIEKTLIEANKCLLLCANCHREYHAGMINKQLLVNILNSDQMVREVHAEWLIKTKVQPLCKDCGKEVSYCDSFCRTCASRSDDCETD